MNKKWRDTFLAHAQTEAHIKRIEQAKKYIAKAFERCAKPYVAFSGGKDSTVALHMVLQHAPDTLVVHWDYGRYYIPQEMREEIISNMRKLGAKNIKVMTSKRYEIEKRQATNILGAEYLGKRIKELAQKGYDGVFVGLRKEESIKRRLRCENSKSITGMKEFFPVQNLSWLDIWGYIVKNQIPYLTSYYDTYASVMGWDKARFATLFDAEFDKFGTSNVDGVLYWRFKNVLQ